MATRPRSIERKFSCVATAACQCFKNQASSSARDYIKLLTHPNLGVVMPIIERFLRD